MISLLFVVSVGLVESVCEHISHLCKQCSPAGGRHCKVTDLLLTLDLLTNFMYGYTEAKVFEGWMYILV